MRPRGSGWTRGGRGPAHALPTTLAEWQGYQAVVLSDLPAYQVSEKQMEWIRALVWETGVGFATLGGPGSAWEATSAAPWRRCCPSTSTSAKRKRPVSVALDRAPHRQVGQHGRGGGGVERLALAREAAIAACELLGKDDYVGVWGFDSGAHWVVHLARVDSPRRVSGKIATPVLRGRHQPLPCPGPSPGRAGEVRGPGQARHRPHPWHGGAGRLRPGSAAGPSPRGSPSAPWPWARAPAWGFIKKDGKGRAYFTDRPSNLPRIFTRETVIAARAAFKEQAFRPAVEAGHSVLRGVNVAQAPPLLGWDLTTSRPPPPRPCWPPPRWTRYWPRRPWQDRRLVRLARLARLARLPRPPGPGGALVLPETENLALGVDGPPLPSAGAPSKRLPEEVR